VFCPDAGFPCLASASLDGTVRIWDVAAGRLIRTLEGHTGGVHRAAFSPDGRLLAAAGMGRVIKIWDTRSWGELDERPDLTGCIHSVVFHPNNRPVLAWGSTDGTIKLWDSATRQIISILHGHASWVESVAFTPDGKWIASASLDGTVKLWRVPPLPKAPDQARGVTSDRK
jgi:WD40 repeat protein